MKHLFFLLLTCNLFFSTIAQDNTGAAEKVEFIYKTQIHSGEQISDYTKVDEKVFELKGAAIDAPIIKSFSSPGRRNG